LRDVVSVVGDPGAKIFSADVAGERTPHDNPLLTATFSGLTHMTGPLHLVQAVLEGVTLALADGHAALAADLP
jgi:xylulokinase